MNKYEELKAWADKWGISYTEHLADDKMAVNQLQFESITWFDATFSYNPKTDCHVWYGGD